MNLDRRIADEPTLPRRNGQLTFDAPWESRAFGLAVALAEAGLIEWSEFRGRLIEEVGRWEREHPDGHGWSYYESWLAALEALLTERSLVGPGELAARAGAVAHERAHDHQH